MPELIDIEFPFLMLTGRGTSSQWHTQTRTAKSDILRKLYPENVYLEIHPADASKLRLKEGDAVTVRSRRGEITVSAYLAPTVQPGQIFIPMHYPEVNRLTYSAFDPHSRQPNYKACAVALTRKIGNRGFSAAPRTPPGIRGPDGGGHGRESTRG